MEVQGHLAEMDSLDGCPHNPEWATADQKFLWPGQYCTSMAATSPPQQDAAAGTSWKLVT